VFATGLFNEIVPNNIGGNSWKEFSIFEEELALGIQSESLCKAVEEPGAACVEEATFLRDIFLRDSTVLTLHETGKQSYQCSPGEAAYVLGRV